MPVPRRSLWRGRRPRSHTRLQVESLEGRMLLSASPVAGPGAPVLDLSAAGGAAVTGTLAHGSAQVDWYQFTLASAADVTLDATGLPGDPLTPVLSLYNSGAADPNDLYNLLNYRLLSQSDGAAAGGAAHLERWLAQGTYFVAVSGTGNRYFNPIIADSGYVGAGGDYSLTGTATPLTLPAGYPALLAVDAAYGNSDRSPLVVRADLSGPLGAGQSVVLTDSTGTQLDMPGSDQFLPAVNEWLLAPMQPLGPGTYTVSIQDSGGATLDSRSFTVTGVEGNTAAGAGEDDYFDGITDTSHPLTLTPGTLVQRVGSIGDDPTDPMPFDPADVDLYHFTITDAGHYAFLAEAFAGRIGSPLDPALTLFRYDAGSNTFAVVAVNDNTGNANDTLALDPMLSAGLTAGDYYLAVTGSSNAPDPILKQFGDGWIFTPAAPHSGFAGFSTGDYVLNLLLEPRDDVPPQVTATTPAEGATVEVPGLLTVQFSEAVDPQQLFLAADQHGPGDPGAIYVLGADNQPHFLRLVSYDSTTNQATFYCMDALPTGWNELHLVPLSAAQPFGISDLAGNPLVGSDPNNPSSDFVLRFQVSGRPSLVDAGAGNSDPSHPQYVGPLFPLEIQAGVTLSRDYTSDPLNPDVANPDYFQIQLLQHRRQYFLNLPDLPHGTGPYIFNVDTGTTITPNLQGSSGNLYLVWLDPGTYVIGIGNWALPSQSAGLKYSLRFTFGPSDEGPTPLTIGPAPALRIRLTPASAPASPPALVLPTTSAGTVTPAVATGGLPSLFTIPPEILQYLSAGPVGGVRSTNDGDGTASAPRLTLSRPPAEGTAPVRPAFVTQTQQASGTDSMPGPSGLSALAERMLRLLDGIWGDGLGGVLPGGSSPEEGPGPPPASPSGGESSSEDEMAAQSNPLAPRVEPPSRSECATLLSSTEDDGETPAPAPDTAWRATLAFLGMAAWLGPRGRRTKRTRTRPATGRAHQPSDPA